MVISEKLKEGILEASLRYGNEEEINSFVIPLTFSSTVSSPFAITEEVSFSDKCLFDNSLDLITTLNLSIKYMESIWFSNINNFTDV